MSTNAQTAGRMPGPDSNLAPYLALAVGVVGLIISFFLALPVLTEGSGAMAMGSDMIWGLPVAGYAFLALASMGVSFVACYALITGAAGWERLTPRLLALGLGLSVGALLVLFLELGNGLRALWAIPTSFQLGAPIVWMGIFWAVYMLLVITALVRLQRVTMDDPATRRIAVGIVLTGVAAAITQGLAYGMFPFRPVWYGIGTPLYYLAGALVSGIAFSLLAAQALRRYTDQPASQGEAGTRVLSHQLPLALGVALIGYLFVTAGQLITGLWSPTAGVQEVYQAKMVSPLFWAGLLLGLVVPLVLMAAPSLRGQAWAQVLAGALAVVGLFISRYEWTIGGQLVPLFKGSWIPGFVEYTPNAVEWGIVLLGFFAALSLYAAGDRLFSSQPAPRR